jgi:hypothetical protein
MKFVIDWAFSLFKKPQVEITFEPEAQAWPFPVSKEKRKPQVKKATTRKAKPAVKAAKKTVKKAK